jgi:hypothetical protein
METKMPKCMENASFYKPKFENIDLMIHEEESEKK